MILARTISETEATLEVLKVVVIVGGIVAVIVFIALIMAIFNISKNTDKMRENVDKMHNQLANTYKLIDIQNELISVAIREQRAMHGYDVNKRLDGKRPDE